MSIKATRVVKFIRKGDKGDATVTYGLKPSATSVTLSNVEGGDGTPTPGVVSCRVVKQVGGDTPTTIATPSSVGLTVSYAFSRSDEVAAQIRPYNGGNISMPTNVAFTALTFYLYQGSLLLDTATVSIVSDGEKGDKGNPGDDGVSYFIVLTPNTLTIDATGKVTTPTNINAMPYKNVGAATGIEATDGVMHLLFTNKTTGEKSDIVTSGIANYSNDIYSEIWFEYRVNNKTVATAAVNINRFGEQGAKGDRGPALRGPQAWSDCATGYKFQAGGNGEQYQDVVLYSGNYYSCKKSHSKNTTNYPGSTADTNNGYWQAASNIELIATKILLASYALVKNLGVESIDMKDANGNVLFQAKDGNVTCKTGTFENIKVSGDITAEYLNLKVSNANHYEDVPALATGSICIQASGIILPELPKGTARSMRVLNTLQSRTSPSNLVLKPASNKVFISTTLSEMQAKNTTQTLISCGHNAGKYFELIGIHEANTDSTYWLLSGMNNGDITDY